MTEHDPIAVDLDAAEEEDSSFGDDGQSETTSVASSIYRGMWENGRKYQTLRRDEYWGPSDEKQYETMELSHLLHMIMESEEKNPLFHAPLAREPQRIMDLGTGKGTWAIEAADTYPSATVYGVDLYPPPSVWVPPNCKLEVDDISKEWTWSQPFDLIHIRMLYGGFTDEEWDGLYKQCYENLEPGGYLEQVELSITVESDDGTLPESSPLYTWGQTFLDCAMRAGGRSLDTYKTMRAAIEKAGFVDVEEKNYKLPLGSWPKDPLLKDAGKVNREHWLAGAEGWAMWLLTRHGAPVPWTEAEVNVYVAKIRQELQNPKYHIYHWGKRVWARKPEA